MGRVTKARIEGATPDPVPGNNGDALDRIAAYFRAEHPEAWEELRLCPLQHGIVEMAKRLK